jgi:hypothetical protein
MIFLIPPSFPSNDKNPNRHRDPNENGREDEKPSRVNRQHAFLLGRLVPLFFLDFLLAFFLMVLMMLFFMVHFSPRSAFI